MPTNKRRDLINSRRRTVDEDDEEEGVLDVEDDSISEDSIITGADADRANENIGAEDSDFDYNEAIGPDTSTTGQILSETGGKSGEQAGHSHVNENGVVTSKHQPHDSLQQAMIFASPEDVLVMQNGLGESGTTADEEAIHYEDFTKERNDISETNHSSTDRDHSGTTDLSKRRVPEIGSYKTRRETDPAFVPTRGGFFMHDHRHSPSFAAQNGSFQFNRGRGRGKGFMGNGAGGTMRPIQQDNEINKDRWDHDLHETVADTQPHNHKRSSYSLAQQHQYKAKETAMPASLSKSVAIGTVTIRVLLPAMTSAVTFEKIPLKQYTKLPDLRPPLRRDKPVRISIPDHPVRYIFPSMERSFIFIPRAQRPNQASNRGRPRGHFAQTGSRRTSAYAGSVYTPSIAMSRRSSMVRDGVISPTGSHISKAAGARTIVRLPSAQQYQMHGQGAESQAAIVSGSNTPAVLMPQGPTYPLPSQPVHRQHRPSHIPMHQPRPQKAVSVATIESPNQIPLHTPQQQEQQPFHQQVPAHMNGNNIHHVRQSSFQAQAARGTPLSNIPEGAINAQPFQPTSINVPAYYQAPYTMPHSYFYAAPPPSIPGISPDHFNPSMMAQPYLPQPSYFMPLMIPAPAPAPVPEVPPSGSNIELQPPPATGAGIYAHESNGMVYYYDPSQLIGSVDPTNADVGYGLPAMDGFYYGQHPIPPDMAYYPTQ